MTQDAERPRSIGKYRGHPTRLPRLSPQARAVLDWFTKHRAVRARGACARLVEDGALEHPTSYWSIIRTLRHRRLIERVHLQATRPRPHWSTTDAVPGELSPRRRDVYEHVRRSQPVRCAYPGTRPKHIPQRSWARSLRALRDSGHIELIDVEVPITGALRPHWIVPGRWPPPPPEPQSEPKPECQQPPPAPQPPRRKVRPRPLDVEGLQAELERLQVHIEDMTHTTTAVWLTKADGTRYRATRQRVELVTSSEPELIAKELPRQGWAQAVAQALNE